MGRVIVRDTPVVQGIVGSDPPASDGQLYKILDAEGKVMAAGYQGGTQKHPLARAGGERVDLSILPQGANGWQLDTGTVVQTADALEWTGSAAEPDCIIDLPYYKTPYVYQMFVEMELSTSNPGNLQFAGVELDSNFAASQRGAVAYSTGVAWFAGVSSGANIVAASGLSVALGSLATIEYARGQFFMNQTTSGLRVLTSDIGSIGDPLPLAGGGRANVSGFEDISVPTTANVRLRAKWISGDDFVVKFKAISVYADGLVLTTVD